MGGVEKGGGWKYLTTDTQTGVSDPPPSCGTFSTPPQGSVLCFSCTKIDDRADQKLFWRGPKVFGESAFSDTFPPPIRFAPPHITGPLFASLPETVASPAQRLTSLSRCSVRGLLTFRQKRASTPAWMHASESGALRSGAKKRGVLAKGASVESSVSRSRKRKIPKDIGPSSTFGTQSATAKRGAHFA